VIVDYIDRHRERFGVEPICAVLAEHVMRCSGRDHPGADQPREAAHGHHDPAPDRLAEPGRD
jgi:hypothetical protein